MELTISQKKREQESMMKGKIWQGKGKLKRIRKMIFFVREKSGPIGERNKKKKISLNSYQIPNLISF